MSGLVTPPVFGPRLLYPRIELVLFHAVAPTANIPALVLSAGLPILYALVFHSSGAPEKDLNCTVPVNPAVLVRTDRI